MKKKLLISSITALGVIIIAYALVSAQGMGMRGPYPPGMGPGMGCFMHRGEMGMHKNPYQMLKRYADEIGLTDDQLNRIEGKSIDAEKKVINLKSRIQLKRVDLRAEMGNEKPNRSVVFKLLDEINSLQGDLKKAHVTLLLDIKDMITPEQEEIIKKIRNEKRKKKMKKFGNRFRGERGPSDFEPDGF